MKQRENETLNDIIARLDGQRPEGGGGGGGGGQISVLSKTNVRIRVIAVKYRQN